LDAHNQLRAADKWMSIASAVLLAAYFVFALYAGASPSNDPQRRMAQGFIIFVALLLVAVGGVLWLQSSEITRGCCVRYLCLLSSQHLAL
jgi:hypothetical protein